MRRFVFLVGIAVSLLVLGVGPAAQAASPIPTPFADSGDDVDTDFCGTGETVQIHYSFKGVEFLEPKNANYAHVAHGVATFTYGDVTLVNRFASRFTDVTVSGDEEGIHTHEFTTLGLPELWKFEHGGVITLDAGSITFIELFDGDEFISGDVVIRGPHPQAESDFELFCQVIPEALGIG
jgi:hypothetical protein